MDFTHSHIHSNNHRITDPNGTRGAVNMEQHIHFLEIHAYSSLLKAFIAQSELLTWGKEELLTEIRKELRIADSEHGEILTRINSDETVKWIREQRKMASHSHAQAYNNTNTTGRPSAPIGNSVIRLKAPPSVATYPQKNIPHSQASLSSIQIPSSMPLKFNDNLTTVQFVHGNAEQPKEMFNYDDAQLSPIGRGSMPKGNCQFVHGSTEPPKEMFNYDAQLPPSGRGSMPKGNCQFVHGSAEPPKEMFNYDAQLPPSGRGSMPKGNCQFVHGSAEPPKEMFNYDAQLPPSGRGSMPKGNCQFVHGSAEPPKEMFNYDAQLPPSGRGSMPKGNCQFVHGNAEPPKEMFNYGVQLPPSGRGSAPKGNYRNKQPFNPSEPPVLNTKSDVIRLRPTDRVIHGVKNMLFNRENPEPVAIERAKQTLHEQERDLLEAIGKLENVLEDNDAAPQNLQNYSGRTGDDGPCGGNFSGL